LKLQAKVIFLTVTVLIIIGLVSGDLMLYFQRKSSVRQFEHLAAALVGAVQGSLEHAMLTGERQPVQDAIMRIGRAEMVNGVILLSRDGKITASSNVSRIGEASDRQEILGTLASGEVSTWTGKQNGSGEFSVVSPVLNQTECQGCHSPASAVLGAIQVSLDTASLDEQTRQQTVFFVLSGWLALLVMGIGLTFALRRIVLKPLLNLADSAIRLSQGDYTARTRGRGADEIGMLARTFNRMADSVEQRSRELEASRQELADWNTDLERKIGQRTAQLAALNAVITTVSQSLDLRGILEAVLVKILSLTGIDAGVIHQLDKKSGRLDIKVYRGLASGSVPAVTKMGQEGIWGQVVESGQSVAINREPDVFKAAGIEGDKGEFRAGMILPLKSENRVLGTLALASYQPDRFQPELARLLQSMSDAIGIGMANAAAAQNLREMNFLREQLLEKLISAQEEERKRIARELHDEASQSLAALVLHLEDIADNLPAKYLAEKRRLNDLKERAVQTLSGIRNLALELRPSVLDHLGLSRAIEWYVKDYLGKRGLEASVDITGPKVKLSPNTETMVFRIIQEALTNVVKHARAKRVSVKLNLTDSRIGVQVEDDGQGFDVDSALSGIAGQKSLGLHGMIERATLLGGTLDIRSEPGRGTSLSIEVPYGRS